MVTKQYNIENVDVLKLKEEIGDLGFEYSITFTDEYFWLDFIGITSIGSELVPQIEAKIEAHKEVYVVPLPELSMEDQIALNRTMIAQILEVVPIIEDNVEEVTNEA